MDLTTELAKKNKLWRMYLAADLEKITLVNGQNWQEKN